MQFFVKKKKLCQLDSIPPSWLVQVGEHEFSVQVFCSISRKSDFGGIDPPPYHYPIDMDI